MKKIKVFLYSYKNKDLFNFCNDLINNSSNEIFIDVYDQNNIDRDKMFTGNKNIKYSHIKWDDRKGIYYYRLMSLYGKFDYFLCISDSTLFSKNWDIDLINACNDSKIISGKNKVNLKLNKFFISSEIVESNVINKTQWISNDFIFLKMSNAILLSKSNFLKTIGDDLLLSIFFSEHNMEIFSMPNYFYNTKNNDNKYIPYSKYHGYNKLLSMIKNKNIKTNKFEKFHNLLLSDIKNLPFETDDVSYYKTAFEIDFEDKTRFHQKINRISFT
jgi:hypothetical protein